MCNCKYHRIYECKRGCNPEIVKLELSSSGENGMRVYTVTNKSTVTLSDSIIICSKNNGRYKKSLCDSPLFPGESVSINGKLSNDDEVIAFVKVGENEYVVSNILKPDNLWWNPSFSTFINGNILTFFFSNGADSQTDALNIRFNVKFFTDISNLLEPLPTKGGQTFVEGDTLIMTAPIIKRGSMIGFNFLVKGSLEGTTHQKFTSDTPIKPGVVNFGIN